MGFYRALDLKQRQQQNKDLHLKKITNISEIQGGKETPRPRTQTRAPASSQRSLLRFCVSLWLGRSNFGSKSWGSKVYVLHHSSSCAQTEFDVNVIAKILAINTKDKIALSEAGITVWTPGELEGLNDLNYRGKERKIPLFDINTPCISSWMVKHIPPPRICIRCTRVSHNHPPFPLYARAQIVFISSHPSGVDANTPRDFNTCERSLPGIFSCILNPYQPIRNHICLCGWTALPVSLLNRVEWRGGGRQSPWN